MLCDRFVTISMVVCYALIIDILHEIIWLDQSELLMSKEIDKKVG